MAPDLGPPGLTVAVEGRAVGVRRRLVVSLQVEHFGNPVVSQGTILIQVERLVELGERSGEIALLLHGLAAEDGRTQLYIRGVGEHMVVGIDGDAPRASEGFNRKG